MKDSRPYLTNRRCGRCIVPLETSERHEEGWLYVTVSCPKCDFKSVVTFSPDELREWARRGKSRATGASWS